MKAPVPEYSTDIYEMMARLGIEPGAGVLPRFSLRYATALRRCETCGSKKACRDWLDYSPAMVNFAPDFCTNADLLFDLQYDQTGPRRLNSSPTVVVVCSVVEEYMANTARRIDDGSTSP